MQANANKKRLAHEMGREAAFSDGFDSGYKTSQRFNIANFSNTKSVTKGFSNKHIQFYNEKKSQIGSRYNNSVGNRQDLMKPQTSNGRNNTLSYTPGMMSNTHRRMTSTAPASVMSKTYENYIRARERAENIAKEKVEHLNQLALQKVKN